MSSENISWRRVAIEATVIVGSILLALTADALWQWRQDRVEEQELLRSLALEVEANQDSLSATMDVLAEARQFVAEWIAADPQDLASMSEEDAHDLLRDSSVRRATTQRMECGKR